MVTIIKIESYCFVFSLELLIVEVIMVVECAIKLGGEYDFTIFASFS